jgi:hypothetical protein
VWELGQSYVKNMQRTASGDGEEAEATNGFTAEEAEHTGDRRGYSSTGGRITVRTGTPASWNAAETLRPMEGSPR